MSVEIVDLEGGKLLEVHLAGKLGKDDYKTLVPAVEKMTREQGKIVDSKKATSAREWLAENYAANSGFRLSFVQERAPRAVVSTAAWTCSRVDTTLPGRSWESYIECCTRAWLSVKAPEQAVQEAVRKR